jgi:hypothetical protein
VTGAAAATFAPSKCKRPEKIFQPLLDPRTGNACLRLYPIPHPAPGMAFIPLKSAAGTLKNLPPSPRYFALRKGGLL